jgi:hypothetical protein
MRLLEAAGREPKFYGIRLGKHLAFGFITHGVRAARIDGSACQPPAS